MKIKITTDHPRSSYGLPVVVIDGEIEDDAPALVKCLAALGWTSAKLAESVGVDTSTVANWRQGRRPIPPNVWTVVGQAGGWLEL